MESALPFEVLLYYKFVWIDDPESFAAEHLALCRKLHLRGRIIVAEEGLNGTVSGLRADTRAYREALQSDPRFGDIAFRADPHHEHAFKRISVKRRAEIVTLGLPVQAAQAGERLNPAQFKAMLADPDSVVIDGRNDYEYDLGHFPGAVRPEFENLKDAPAWLERTLEGKQDRPILTYCTGGIRCEKLSAYLVSRGFKHVYQLDGGIVGYGQDPEVQGQGFEGKCFVFDERISVSIDRTGTAPVVARCYHCAVPCEEYVNCANVKCNRLFICCLGCEAAFERCCCEACRKAPAKRKKGESLSAG